MFDLCERKSSMRRRRSVCEAGMAGPMKSQDEVRAGQANNTNKVHGTIKEGYKLIGVTAPFRPQTRNSEENH